MVDALKSSSSSDSSERLLRSSHCNIIMKYIAILLLSVVAFSVS